MSSQGPESCKCWSRFCWGTVSSRDTLRKVHFSPGPQLRSSYSSSMPASRRRNIFFRPLKQAMQPVMYSFLFWRSFSTSICFIWWWLIQSLLFFRQELHCYVEAVELPPECHLLIGRKHVYFSQGGWSSSSSLSQLASSQLDSFRSYIYIWILSYRYILLYIYISHDPVQIPRIFPWIFQHFPSHKSRASGCVEWHPSRDVQKRLSALVEPAVFQLWKMDPWCPAQKQLRQLRSDRSFFSDLRYSMVYPLVNCPITMGNHHFQWVNPLFLWPFSIAILT